MTWQFRRSPSVYPTETLRYSVKTAKYYVKLLSLSDIPIRWCFLITKIHCKILTELGYTVATLHVSYYEELSTKSLYSNQYSLIVKDILEHIFQNDCLESLYPWCFQMQLLYIEPKIKDCRSKAVRCDMNLAKLQSISPVLSKVFEHCL